MRSLVAFVREDLLRAGPFSLCRRATVGAGGHRRQKC